MSARIRLQAYLEDERIKKIYDGVKSAFDGRDFVVAPFYTKAGQKIAARRGGIEIRREFFSDLLAELEEYER